MRADEQRVPLANTTDARVASSAVQCSAYRDGPKHLRLDVLRAKQRLERRPCGRVKHLLPNLTGTCHTVI